MRLNEVHGVETDLYRSVITILVLVCNRVLFLLILDFGLDNSSIGAFTALVMELRLYQQEKAAAEAAIAAYEADVKRLQEEGILDENAKYTQKAEDIFAKMAQVG